MTNTIQPYNYSSIATQATDGSPTSSGSSAKPAAQSVSDQEVESVTLSAAAQTNAALVNAARGANGVDQAHVNAIKQALANGSYNVSPEDLASAISAVLSETQG